MIKIILNGCGGKMGRTVSQVVKKHNNLSIAAGIDKNASQIKDLDFPVFSKISECNIDADVVVDYSRPNSLDELLEFCTKKSMSLIICTTGHTEEQNQKIKEYSKNIPIFHSANMSIGINVMNNILKKISSLLYPDFDIEIVEKHHNQKVDAPSGTALMLANTIKKSIPDETSFVNGRCGIAKRKHSDIGIHAIRGGSIVGEHYVIFAGQGETIEIKHEALSREVFAIGTLKACEFIVTKPNGLYSMDDIVAIE